MNSSQSEQGQSSGFLALGLCNTWQQAGVWEQEPNLGVLVLMPSAASVLIVTDVAISVWHWNLPDNLHLCFTDAQTEVSKAEVTYQGHLALNFTLLLPFSAISNISKLDQDTGPFTAQAHRPYKDGKQRKEKKTDNRKERATQSSIYPWQVIMSLTHHTHTFT